jgi:hypothetical protein
VRVYQKQPDVEDGCLCYCFVHTTGDIRAEVISGKQTIVNDINAGIQAGQCACDWRNPQGHCCLGNVRQLIQQIQDEMSSKLEIV